MIYYFVVDVEKYICIIFSPSGSIECNCSEISLLEKLAQQMGTTLKGLKNGTTKITGYDKKIPIFIRSDENMILFPFHSENKKFWINALSIKDVYKDGDDVVILFEKDTLRLKGRINQIRWHLMRCEIYHRRLRFCYFK